MCMGVLCLRSGCMFCVTFPELDFTDLFSTDTESGLVGEYDYRDAI